MKTKPTMISTVLLALMLVIQVTALQAQDEESRRSRGKSRERSEQPDTNKKSAAASEAKDKPGPITAIVGGDIHTVTGPVIRGGTLLIQDGKILELGNSVEVPEGAKTIDATGRVITPGFIAINMSGLGVQSTPQKQDKLADALNA